MGIIKTALAFALAYTSFRVAETCVKRIAYALALLWQVILAAGRAADVLFNPPSSSLYNGAPTWWIHFWNLLTLGPVQSLFAPGSFAHSYALLVVPALAVALVASLALLARSSAMAELFKALVRGWRGLLATTACIVSALLLDDALRAYALVGRLFVAALRVSAATLLGFCGLVELLGPPESGGFSMDQRLEWLRALSLMAVAATSAAGGGILIVCAVKPNHHIFNNNSSNMNSGSSGNGTSVATAWAAGPQQATPTATAPDAPLAPAVDQFSFLLYGSLMLVAAAVSASSLTENGLLSRLLGTMLRLLRLLTVVVRVPRWIRELRRIQAILVVAANIERADKLITQVVRRELQRTAHAVRFIKEVLKRRLGSLRRGLALVASLLRGLCVGVMQSVSRVVAVGLRRIVDLAVVARMALTAFCRYVLQPVSKAVFSAAATFYIAVMEPMAAAAWVLLRQWLVPLLWPTGAAAGAAWFLREAVVQGAVLPFGPAAAVSTVICAMMSGKALRKSHTTTLSTLGDSLERYATTVYLRLDLGLSRPMGRLLGNTITTAWLTATLLLASGRRVLALLAAPLAGLLAAALTAVAWIWRYVGKVLYPWVAAAGRSVVAAVEAIWSHPEWSLVLAAAVLAAAYGAHSVQMPAAVWRLMTVWAPATMAAAVRCLSWPLALLLRLLVALASRGGAWLGVSSGTLSQVAAGTAKVVAGWGRSSGSNMASLFSSRSFAGTFLGLNLLHAVLLKGWAVPVLEAQGRTGREAVVPVISFVARSTGKVALGPMYLTAAASFFVGGGASGLAARLASLTTPALWVLYLAALWLEGVRRIFYKPSEAARALQAVRNCTRHSGPVGGMRPQMLGAGWPLSRTLRSFLQFAFAIREVAAPPAAAPSVASLERRLHRDILAQGPQARVFSADQCGICLEELTLEAGTMATGPEAQGQQGRWQQGADGPLKEESDPENDGRGALVPLALRCGHMFHPRCVLRWLASTPRCPVCREPALGGFRHTNMLF